MDVAILLRDRSGLCPLMVMANQSMADRVEETEAADIRLLDVSAELEAEAQAASPKLNRAMDSLAPWFERHERLANCLPVSILRLMHMRRRLQAEHAAFHRLCERERPVAILTHGDRELSPIPGILRAGIDLDIPRVLVGAGPPGPEGTVLVRLPYSRFRLDLRHFPPLLNLFAAWRYPEQVLRTTHGRMLFSPGWIVFALASLGMLPRNPWVQGGGNSTAMLQENRDHLAGYREMNVPDEKMILVGDPVYDDLYHAYQNRKAIRAELSKTYDLQADRKLVIMSVPNDAEHGICDMPTHQARMDRYFSVMAKHDADILLSLHPKSLPADYSDLAERHGFRFLTESLQSTLPAGDLFVACGSSTIQWAQLCDLPTINLDYQKVRTEDIHCQAGIENIETLAEFSVVFERAMTRTAPDNAFLIHSERVRRDSLFDGNSGGRICAFFEGLAEDATGSVRSNVEMSAA